MDSLFISLAAEAVSIHPKGEAILNPGPFVKDPVSAISLGLALMLGTAGLPHILMRFFTVGNAREARKICCLGNWIYWIFLFNYWYCWIRCCCFLLSPEGLL